MPDTGHTLASRPPPPPGNDARHAIWAAPGATAALPLIGSAGRRFALLLGAVLLLLAGSFAAISQRDHEAALEEGWGTAERAAFGAAEHAERGLAAARLVTDRVAETVRRDGPAAFRGEAGQQDLVALLRHAPQIRSIWVMDAAGRVRSTSTSPDPPATDVADRPYFAPLRDGAEALVSPLLFGRVGGNWFMGFNRAVRDGEGHFIGLVQASLHAADFQRFQARLGLGVGGRVGLFRAADRAPLMLHPLPPGPAADGGAPPSPMMAQAPRLPAPESAIGQEGRFEAMAPGGERLLVAWRIAGEGMPFIAVAGLPRAAALAPFHDRLFRNAMLFGLATVVVGGLAWAVAAAMARGAVDRAAAEAGERELAAVLEATGEGVFAVDPDWRITFVNREGAALLGRGADLVGTTVWQAFPKAMTGPMGAACRQVMAARAPVSEEAICPALGRRLHIDVHPRGDGGIFVFVRDVTAAHDGAQRIAESEARLRRVMDNLFAFVGVLAPDGTLLEANRAPLEKAGVRLEDIRGLPFWDCPWWLHDPAAQARTRDACLRAAAGETLRYDIEVRLAGGGRMTLDFQVAPLRDAEGRITHLIPSATDITARTAAEEALAETGTRLVLAQEAAEFGVFERSVQHAGLHWSASMFRLYGLDPALHGPWIGVEQHLALIHPADRAMHEARRSALRADATQTRFAYEFRIRRADTGETRWIASRGEIQRDATGCPILSRGVNYDVTERRRAEERQMLLAREVDHRAKNALAVVQSIVALTRDTDPERFRAAVTGRIAALARAHTLLARDGWDSAGLRELIEEEVAPYRVGAEALDRVTLDGPEVALAPGAAQPLAMALHELATNAAKYGALSVPPGRVVIRWHATEGGGLGLRWAEHGGPALPGPPARRGFGSSVIRNTVERQLGGRCAFDWRAEGLACGIDLPAAQLRWPEAVGE